MKSGTPALANAPCDGMYHQQLGSVRKNDRTLSFTLPSFVLEVGLVTFRFFVDTVYPNSSNCLDLLDRLLKNCPSNPAAMSLSPLTCGQIEPLPRLV